MNRNYVDYGYADHTKQLLSDAYEKLRWGALSWEDFDELIDALKAVRNEAKDVLDIEL